MEIIIIKLLEENNIMENGLIDGSFHSAADLAGHTVAVLVVYQKVRQIAMPEIAVKTVVSGQFQQSVQHIVDAVPHLRLCLTRGTVLLRQCQTFKLIYHFRDYRQQFKLLILVQRIFSPEQISKLC